MSSIWASFGVPLLMLVCGYAFGRSARRDILRYLQEDLMMEKRVTARLEHRAEELMALNDEQRKALARTAEAIDQVLFVAGYVDPDGPPDMRMVRLEEATHLPGNRFCVCRRCRYKGPVNNRGRRQPQSVHQVTVSQIEAEILKLCEVPLNTPERRRKAVVKDVLRPSLPFADGAPASTGRDTLVEHVWWCPAYAPPGENHSERFARLIKVQITPSTARARCPHPDHQGDTA